MSSRLNPYLSFADNARQAMEFYRGVFGGELTMNTFGEMGGAAPGDENKIMHAQLETPAGYTLMASDAPAGMPHSEGSSISVSLSGDDTDDLRGYFTKLSEGGTVTHAAGEADVGRRVRHVRGPVRRSSGWSTSPSPPAETTTGQRRRSRRGRLRSGVHHMS